MRVSPSGTEPEEPDRRHSVQSRVALKCVSLSLGRLIAFSFRDINWNDLIGSLKKSSAVHHLFRTKFADALLRLFWNAVLGFMVWIGYLKD